MIALAVLALCLLTGCDRENGWLGPGPGPGGPGMGHKDNDGGGTDNSDDETTDISGESGTNAGVSDVDADKNNFDKTVTVVFSASGAAVTNKAEGVLVTENGAYITVNMETNDVKNVKIILSGTTSDGGLKIYGKNKFELSLEGVSITSGKGPAINSQCHKRMFLVVKEGTSNTLCDCASYTDDPHYLTGHSAGDEDRKGCLFAEGNIVMSGLGSLTVAGKNNHAICTDGCFYSLENTKLTVTEAANNCLHVKYDESDGVGVLIKDGTFNFTVASNAGKGIKCDDKIVIEGGTINITTSGNAIYDSATKDTSSASCIKSDSSVLITGGTLDLKSSGSGGKGIKADTQFQMDGGSLTISTSGSQYKYSSSMTSSPKGIKADQNLIVNGGEINVTTTGSEGEGIESKGNISVNGGAIWIQARDDAMNAAGVIAFYGGYTFAYSTGNDGIDSNYGKKGAVLVDGGVVMGHGKASPEEGIDADNESFLVFRKGAVFTTGGLQGGGGMGGSSSSPECGQPTLGLRGSSMAKGYFTVTDNDGKVLVSFLVPAALSQCYSYVTCEKFTAGESYKYGVAGSAPSGYDTNWHDTFYTGGTSSVSAGTYTAASGYTSVGGTSGGGGGGGGGWPGRW